MPTNDTPAYAPDLLALQVESLRAQRALAELPDTASQSYRNELRARATQAAVELYRHPGKLESQQDGKWAKLREAAQKMLDAEAAGADTPAP